jgi:AcrR family transcriptional regulator
VNAVNIQVTDAPCHGDLPPRQSAPGPRSRSDGAARGKRRDRPVPARRRATRRRIANREALVSAIAAVGYRELAERLAAAHPSPSTPEQLASVAIAYVQFALERPALFRIMFGEPCNRDDDERVAATAAVSAYVRSIAQRTFPQADAEALATAIWALVHGLAFLYLDGKLDAPTPSAVADRVTAAIQALLTATRADGRAAAAG